MPTSREIRRVRRARRIARTLLEHRGRDVARRIAPFWTPDRRLRALPARFAADGDWLYRHLILPAEREHARWAAAQRAQQHRDAMVLLGERTFSVIHFTRTR